MANGSIFRGYQGGSDAYGGVYSVPTGSVARMGTLPPMLLPYAPNIPAIKRDLMQTGAMEREYAAQPAQLAHEQWKREYEEKTAPTPEEIKEDKDLQKWTSGMGMSLKLLDITKDPKSAKNFMQMYNKQAGLKDDAIVPDFEIQPDGSISAEFPLSDNRGNELQVRIEGINRQAVESVLNDLNAAPNTLKDPNKMQQFITNAAGKGVNIKITRKLAEEIAGKDKGEKEDYPTKVQTSRTIEIIYDNFVDQLDKTFGVRLATGDYQIDRTVKLPTRWGEMTYDEARMKLENEREKAHEDALHGDIPDILSKRHSAVKARKKYIRSFIDEYE